MLKLLWNTFKVSPVLLGTFLVFVSHTLAAEKAPDQAQITTETQNPSSQSLETPVANAIAPATVNTSNLEQIQQYSNESTDENSLGQITNASQFRDVQPSDWAYEALDRIVQKYGCLVGYPDGTYRGSRALSRYEFAAGLNACLKQVEALIASQPDSVNRKDFEALQRLTEEFRTELATLGTRVDNLEGRTQFLEDHQFSTTTKLAGEVIFNVADAFGDKRAVTSGATTGSRGNLDVNTVFSDRVRLNFDTSFTGKDRLRTRLQARNTVPFTRTGVVGASGDTGTAMTRLGFDGNEDNAVSISRLEYRFPLTPKAQVYIAPAGAEYNEYVPNFNPLFEASGSGSVSRFGRFNPIYRQSGEGTGAVLNYSFSKPLTLSVGYLVPKNGTAFIANDPRPGYGLFNGGYAALAQLAIRPSDAFNIGLTYVHSYNNSKSGVNVSGSTGSNFANQPFGNIATSANQYGLEANFRLNPRITLAGWAGYTTATAEAGASKGSDASIWNWAVNLGFSDFGKKGNLLGFIFGMPPKATSNDISTREDKDTSYHLEALYRYRVTNNIDVTPGLIVILNPEHNDSNDTIYVGTLRTTFRF
jgi:BMFP domain-containing protein YqiC